jgi:hypothetical protein
MSSRDRARLALTPRGNPGSVPGWQARPLDVSPLERVPVLSLRSGKSAEIDDVAENDVTAKACISPEPAIFSYSIPAGGENG